MVKENWGNPGSCENKKEVATQEIISQKKKICLFTGKLNINVKPKGEMLNTLGSESG